jgi:hypothetical protein
MTASTPPEETGRTIAHLQAELDMAAREEGFGNVVAAAMMYATKAYVQQGHTRESFLESCGLTYDGMMTLGDLAH